MSDEMNMTPELTLTPNLEGAAAIEAPALTLDPTAAETAVQQADEAARDANSVQLDESVLS